MPYKFEQLDVWKLSLEYIDSIYLLAEKLPKSEVYNLKSQIIRTATSISLNIAEGSTGQSDAEQARFLGFAIRSLIETVACHHIIHAEATPKIRHCSPKSTKTPKSSPENHRRSERLSLLTKSEKNNPLMENTTCRNASIVYGLSSIV